ncbi:hypothetical protein HDU85_000448 [Gaertneriomyces sp. JEL0708]|nr:hypothetical protein HDU85_000448 [Gaertneriomyces sp. JEL0708]
MSVTRPSDWYRRQSRDQFVHKRITEGYRSRAAFKLLEIQQRYKVMKPGGVCLELGGAPGGWAQVAVEIIGSDVNKVELNSPSSKSSVQNGCVVSIDLLPMDPIPGVHILQGDVTQPEDLEAALNVIKEVTTTPLDEGEAVRPISKPGAYGHIDTLLSDLSHSHTGNRSLDSSRMEELNSLTLQVALYPRMLKQGGSFVCKVFDSAEARAFQKEVGNWFKTTKIQGVKSERMIFRNHSVKSLRVDDIGPLSGLVNLRRCSKGCAVVRASPKIAPSRPVAKPPPVRGSMDLKV